MFTQKQLSTFSENSFSAHFSVGFPQKESKHVNITKKLSSSAVLGGMSPGCSRLSLPALTEQLVLFSTELVAAAEFKERSYVQEHNSQRP